MSSPSERVEPPLLREWGLPDPGESKKSRGRVMVVGGSRRSPGAAILGAEAALRVGAGRLGLIVPASIEGALGVVIPEAAVFSLPAHASDPFEGAVRDELATADAVLVGPGFDNADETRATLSAVADTHAGCLVLDAFALGVLADVDRASLPSAVVLTPNDEEASILLGRDLAADRAADIAEIARAFDAVVSCYGIVASPTGASWQVRAGGAGLATSGSGDVLAGAIAGFAARGIEPVRAAVWGTWVHARAGDRLTERVGVGFLARDLLPELSLCVKEVFETP